MDVTRGESQFRSVPDTVVVDPGRNGELIRPRQFEARRMWDVTVAIIVISHVSLRPTRNCFLGSGWKLS